MKNNKGFSLVELIVVIAIMAILAAVAIPTFATFIDKANVASDVSFVTDAEYVAEVANTINGTQIKDVYVTVGNDKKAASVSVVFAGVPTADDATPDDIIITVDKNGDVKKGDVADTTNDWAKDIAAALDWNYTFKKYAAGNWELDTDGKALETYSAE